MKYGKWIGGALGWAVGGPIGAAFGFFMGYMYDDNSDEKASAENRERYRHHTQGGDFAASLIALSAGIMKADGKVLKSELNYVKEFFLNNFGKRVAEHHIKALREVLKQDIDLRKMAEQIRYYMEHHNRILLLQYLFGIAYADDDLDKRELELLRNMAMWMGISNKDFESIKAMFHASSRGREYQRSSRSNYRSRFRRRTKAQALDDAYTILEINKTATDQEVKSAYRRMARKYHPDKNRGLGEEYQEMAKEKFIKAQEAYEMIKETRGMK